MKKNISTIFIGILIIVLGVIFLGNSLNIWNVQIFFDGWWTVFIIIPSIIGLLKREALASSFLGLSIGILLLLASQEVIKWNMVGKIFIPIILIVIGLLIIFKPGTKKIDKKNLPEYIGLFSSIEEKANKNFKGANCIAIFGGVELDLRDVDIKSDISINCTTIFGGIDIIAPKNVNIKTSGMPIFGGIENQKESKEESAPTIYINYVCIFAGIDIK